jgi:hypothetical protein
LTSERTAGFHTNTLGFLWHQSALPFAAKKGGKHSHVWLQNGPITTQKKHGTEGRIVTLLLMPDVAF